MDSVDLDHSKQLDSLGDRIFDWPLRLYRADYEDIKDTNGLDAYFFVHFLRMVARIMLPIWLVSWAVLMPVDAVKTSVQGNSGLDIFTFGNIAPNQPARYAAHIILAWVFTCELPFMQTHVPLSDGCP